MFIDIQKWLMTMLVAMSLSSGAPLAFAEDDILAQARPIDNFPGFSMTIKRDGSVVGSAVSRVQGELKQLPALPIFVLNASQLSQLVAVIESLPPARYARGPVPCAASAQLDYWLVYKSTGEKVLEPGPCGLENHNDFKGLQSLIGFYFREAKEIYQRTLNVRITHF